MIEVSNLTGQLVQDAIQERIDQINRTIYQPGLKEIAPSLATGVLVGAGLAVTAIAIAVVAWKGKWFSNRSCEGKSFLYDCKESYWGIPLVIVTVGPVTASIPGVISGFLVDAARENLLRAKQRRWTELKLTVTDENALDVLAEHARKLPDSALSPCMAVMSFEENALLRESLEEQRFWSLTVSHRELGEQSCAWWLVRKRDSLSAHRQQAEDYIERYPGFEDAIGDLDEVSAS